MRLLLLLACCGLLSAVDIERPAFRQQWYDQGAELTRYALVQSRYGAERHGDAVFITVTEPLSTTGQVKSDRPDAADAVPGMKLNMCRSFLTGIYPYSVMQTVLQPLPPGSRSLKLTTSVQEWCGHVFEQWNRLEAGWRQQLFSYFQSEGDVDQNHAEAWLEEEVWLRVRIDPTTLPSGTVQMIPGAVSRRFAHRAAGATSAQASLVDLPDGLRRFTVRYPEIERRLQIDFEAAFPHRIQAWLEEDRGQLTTATATHRIMDPYWQHNRPGDEVMRGQLGLPAQ